MIYIVYMETKTPTTNARNTKEHTMTKKAADRPVLATDLTEGTRIYYTGDMANHPGVGTVVKVRLCDWYGFTYDIVIDAIPCKFGHDIEERQFLSVHLISFQPAPGRRFWTEALHDENHAEQIAELRDIYCVETVEEEFARENGLTTYADLVNPF